MFVQTNITNLRAGLLELELPEPALPACWHPLPQRMPTRRPGLANIIGGPALAVG